MIKLKLLLESLLKETHLRGEWWFQDGQAVFADGDVGDRNHEAIVIDTLRRQVLDALDVDTGNLEYVPDIGDGSIRDKVFQSISDELTPQELEDWENHEFNNAIASYLTRKGDKNIKEIIYYIRGHDDKGKTLDVREYALIHWGWQRVKGNTIQTQNLRPEDLQNISRGLYDAYGDELEEKDDSQISELNPLGEVAFDIEVNSTRSWYVGVPISILEKKDPTSLNPYRTRY